MKPEIKDSGCTWVVSFCVSLPLHHCVMGIWHVGVLLELPIFEHNLGNDIVSAMAQVSALLFLAFGFMLQG